MKNLYQDLISKEKVKIESASRSMLDILEESGLKATGLSHL